MWVTLNRPTCSNRQVAPRWTLTVERESAKLYAILQGSVDRDMENPGFVPKGNGNGAPSPHVTNGHVREANGDQWSCSEKQRDLVLKIRDEHRLAMDQIEEISKQLFQRPAKALNKLEMSVLIKELLEEFGPKGTNGNSNGNGRRPYQWASRTQALHGLMDNHVGLPAAHLN